MEEPQYTVFIRVPIPRRGFVDPAPVSWDVAKDEALWKILSGHKEIDCMMQPLVVMGWPRRQKHVRAANSVQGI
ncbi:hypothetical protein ACSS6W_010285 [Trichoderma asperelloides]